MFHWASLLIQSRQAPGLSELYTLGLQSFKMSLKCRPTTPNEDKLQPLSTFRLLEVTRHPLDRSNSHRLEAEIKTNSQIAVNQK